MADERLKLAVFVDFDNIQIGVKDTLAKEFDVSVVLEALKERGEVVTKVAYGDWNRAGEQSRQMTQHAVQMVQRNVTPRGDKNGADINLALDALEMAFTRHHINAFAIVGGDSDFITLVEKLKQYDKRVFVVGGRAFTSLILQRNCHEFIAYENLLKSAAGGLASRPARSTRAPGRATPEGRPLGEASANIRRALKILAEREVAPQLGVLKSTLLQLDSTFSERDYGAGSFLEFMQKMERAHLVHLRRSDGSYVVEWVDTEASETPRVLKSSGGTEVAAPPALETTSEEVLPPSAAEPAPSSAEVLALLKRALDGATAKAPNRPLYMRHVRQALRSEDKNFDERRSGFRGLLDLLHQAQREGWVRLQRDRKGVWRIFPVSAPSAGPTAVAEPLADQVAPPAGAIAPPAAEVMGEGATQPEEVAGAEGVVPEVAPLGIEEVPVTPASTERKVRKPRGARTSGRSGPRKSPNRRKS